jgi:hypothetical protein
MTNGTQSPKYLGAVLIFIVGIALLAPGNLKSATTPEQKEWAVRYDSGTKAMRSRAKMNLTLEEDRIVLRCQHKVFVSIPVSQVMDLSFEVRTRHPWDDAQRRYSEAVYDAAADDIGGIINSGLDYHAKALGVTTVAAGMLVAEVPAALMSVPIKTQEHLVTIHWQVADEEFVAVLGMGNDYSEFISQLRRDSQIPIHNIVNEVKEYKSGGWIPAELGVSGNTSDARNLPGPHAKHWKMTYAEGLDELSGVRLKVSMDPERIYLEPEHSSHPWRVSISTSEILDVWYMPVMWAPVPQFRPGAGGPFQIDRGPGSQSAFDPDINSIHFVRINLKCGPEGSRQFLLRVRLHDRSSILKELAEVTGKPWKDMRYDRIEEESSDAGLSRLEGAAQQSDPSPPRQVATSNSVSATPDKAADLQQRFERAWQSSLDKSRPIPARTFPTSGLKLARAYFSAPIEPSKRCEVLASNSAEYRQNCASAVSQRSSSLSPPCLSHCDTPETVTPFMAKSRHAR